MSYAVDEYAPKKLTEAHWLVLKFSGHHGTYIRTYEVRKSGNGWYCTCAAGHNCKHIKMVLDYGKKPLF
jgi:SWIM zinc finger